MLPCIPYTGIREELMSNDWSYLVYVVIMVFVFVAIVLVGLWL